VCFGSQMALCCWVSSKFKQTDVLCQQFHSSPVGMIHEEAVVISSVRGDECFLAFGFWLPTGIQPQLNLLIGINLHDTQLGL